MKVNICIILDSKSSNHLDKCLNSISENTPESHEITFIAEDPEEEHKKWIKKFAAENKKLQFIEEERGKILFRDFNEAVKNSTGDYIVILSSNTIVTKSWLSDMLEHLGCEQDIGIVGPMGNNIQGIQNVPGTDNMTERGIEDFADSFREKNRYRCIGVKTLDGFCILFRRSLFDTIGLFDKGLESKDLMIEDFCLRTTLEGYKNVIAGDLFVYSHKNNAYSASKRLFNEKWSGIDIKSNLGKKVFALNSMQRADMLFQKGMLDASFGTLMNAISKTPDNKILYYRLSEMLINNGQFEDALDILDKMPQNGEENKKLELTVYCKLGLELYDDAQEMADKLISLDDRNAKALNLKGKLAYKLGDTESADNFFRKAMEIAPGYGEPYTNRGKLLWNEGNKKEALGLYEKGFILSPEIMDIATSYHSALAELNDFSRAEGIFQDALALHPNNQRLKYLFIDMLLRQEKYNQAMEEIENAIVLFGPDEGLLAAALNVRDRLGVHSGENSETNVSSISLCMIVKDEEEYLARCLRSAKPVVDEIIIVDTGSSDRTKDIARAFGARVFDFKWKEDFSEARNFSISKATKDWIFILDADEVISPIDYRNLRAIVENTKNSDYAYEFVTRNYMEKSNIIGWVGNDGKYANEEAGTGWMHSIKVRLFRSASRIYFSYPVHEVLEPSLKDAGLKVSKCDIPIHHYGKIDTKKTAAKGDIYYQIGKKKLESEGDNFMAVKELAVQASIQEEYEESLELWKRVIKIRPDFAEAYINMSTIYARLGRYEEGLFASKMATKIAPGVKEGHYNLALCNLHIENVIEAISRLKKLVEKTPEYMPAQFMLAASYCCKGNKERCLRGLEKLRHTSFGPGLAISCHTLAKGLLDSGNLDYAIRLLEAAIESKNVNKDVLTLFKECIEKKMAIKSKPQEGANI